MVAQYWRSLHAFEYIVIFRLGHALELRVCVTTGVVGRLPAWVLVVGGAIECENGSRWLDATLDGSKSECHAEVAASGPSDHDDFLGVNSDVIFEPEYGKRVTAPVESITDIGHGAACDGDFRAEAVVDADRKEAVVEKELCLLASDIFSR